MKEPEYIVKKSQIINAVKGALEVHISNPTIVKELMTSVNISVEIVLEDDCEEMTEDMWEMFMT